MRSFLAMFYLPSILATTGCNSVYWTSGHLLRPGTMLVTEHLPTLYIKSVERLSRPPGLVIVP